MLDDYQASMSEKRTVKPHHVRYYAKCVETSQEFLGEQTTMIYTYVANEREHPRRQEPSQRA
jgi:hypothetical protein